MLVHERMAGHKKHTHTCTRRDGGGYQSLHIPMSHEKRKAAKRMTHREQQTAVVPTGLRGLHR